jgi:hypothetical protein
MRSGQEPEVEIHRLAQEDLANIEDWDIDRCWYPKIMKVLATVAVGPKVNYSLTPDNLLKYEPIHSLRKMGIPGYHIVWEKELNGFRPLILDEDSLLIVTGIAFHGYGMTVPGFSGQINYDDPADPQIHRMIEIHAQEIEREGE